MRWFKPNIKNSLYNLLCPTFAPSQSWVRERTEDVREAMLEQLGPQGTARYPQTTKRLRYASDAHALWHLRSHLMSALAAMHGEEEARLRIASLTLMFEGLLPRGLKPRSSRLGSEQEPS